MSSVQALTSFVALLAQALVGLPLAHFLLKFEFSTIERYSISFSLGTLVLAIVDQIVVNLGYPSRFVALAASAGLMSWGLVHTRRYQIPSPTNYDFRLVATAPLFILLGYGDFTRSRLIAFAVLLLAFLISLLPKVSRSVHATKILVTGTICFLFVNYLNPTVVPDGGSTLLRPLYTGTDDTIFSESMAWSLSNLGLRNYAAATGVSVRYHWLSLAWSGFIQKLCDLDPFVTTLHVVPVVSFVSIYWLLFAISRISGRSQLHGAISALILFGTASPIDPTRFFFTLNTSNLLPYSWLLLLVISAAAHRFRLLRLPYISLPIISSALLLAKVPLGVSALIGMFALLFLGVKTNRIANASIFILVLISVCFIYVAFLSPHEWEQRRFQFTWSWGGLAPGSFAYPIIPMILIGFVFATSFIGLLLVKLKSVSLSGCHIEIFILCGSLVGFLRFVLSGGSAELYFYAFTILGGALLNGFVVGDHLQSLSHSEICTLLLFGFTALLATGLLSKYVELTGISDTLLHILLPGMVGVIAIVCSLLGGFKLRTFAKVRSKEILVTCILFSTCFFQIGAFFQKTDFSMLAAVPTRDLEAFTWLQKVVPTDEVIATNRFLCSQGESCGFDESSFLLSAVGQHQILIEGPRFVVGGRPYPSWVIERIELSLNFANNPTKKSRDDLIALGVDWFVLDDNFVVPRRDTRNQLITLGSIRYSKDGLSIIHFTS